jgi:fatty acid desaturase
LVRELPYQVASDAQSPFSRSPKMLWTIAVILFILWLLGFVVLHVGGGLIHLLLVLAIIAVVWRLVTGRPAV